jgi:AcrR family transcriptional regulator
MCQHHLMPDASPVRPYRGVAAADRVASRREALIDAALEVFAQDGWDALSARRICEQAGLARRYFYESFDDLSALLAAAHERVIIEVQAAMLAAIAEGPAPLDELAARALSAALDVMAVPRSKGRFFMLAQSRGTPMPHGGRGLVDLATMTEGVLTTHPAIATQIGPRDARITAVILVGAVRSVIDVWLAQTTDLTRDEVISWSVSAILGIIDAATARAR